MSEREVIKIRCRGADALDINDMAPIQGELKNLSTQDKDTFKRRIKKFGVIDPIMIWKNKEDHNILSGTQRWTVLCEMREAGFVVPKIPVNYVEADSLKEAKEHLLAYVSQFGKVTEKGLTEFLMDGVFTPEDLANFKIPDFNMLGFLDKWAPPTEDGLNITPDMDLTSDGAFQKVESHVRMQQLFFNEVQATEFLEKVHRLQAMMNKDNITDTVLEVVRESYKTHFPGE